MHTTDSAPFVALQSAVERYETCGNAVAMLSNWASAADGSGHQAAPELRAAMAVLVGRREAAVLQICSAAYDLMGVGQ